jgi:7-carboxy-7-deazaguanine synthase
MFPPVSQVSESKPASREADRLRVTEIFYSLQGETRTVGCPTVFVRLTGCPLRCGYCDTTYAFTEGEWMALDDILSRVAGYGARHVTVTGGEPLAQRPCRELLARLCEAGYSVSLETSGALDIAGIDPRVSVVMDLKTPGSGEEAKNLYANIAYLRAQDQVKFVITDRTDYEWSRARVREHNLAARCEVLLSPVHGRLAPRELADWILADRLPVRMQVQLHKLLWGEARGR